LRVRLGETCTPPPRQPPALKPRPKNAKIGPRPFCAPWSLRNYAVGEKTGRACGSCDRGTPPTISGAFTIMDVQEEVKIHTRKMEAGERVRYAQACPGCGAVEKKLFRMHDCRRRKFRLVLGQCIQVAMSWILRWRCLRCGKRFTDYPPFRVAAEAVCPAAGVGEGQRVFGNRSVLP
jgi:hypothetical protein